MTVLQCGQEEQFPDFPVVHLVAARRCARECRQRRLLDAGNGRIRMVGLLSRDELGVRETPFYRLVRFRERVEQETAREGCNRWNEARGQNERV